MPIACCTVTDPVGKRTNSPLHPAGSLALPDLPLAPHADSNSSAALYVNGCIAAYRGVPWCHEDHDHQNQCKPMPLFTSYLKVLSVCHVRCHSRSVVSWAVAANQR